MSSVQNKIDELHETYLNQTYDEKTNYFKKISEIENKCQRWTNKYNELYDKYLRLEAKCVNIEQENCSKIRDGYKLFKQLLMNRNEKR